MEKLMIEAGKYYKTRGKGKAFVAAVELPTPWGPQGGHRVSVYMEGEAARNYHLLDGRRYPAVSEDSCFDLVEEWREPATLELTVYLRQEVSSPKKLWYVTDLLQDSKDIRTIGSVKVTLVEGRFAS